MNSRTLSIKGLSTSVARKKIKPDMISFVYNGKKVNFVKPDNPDYISDKIESTGTFYEIELLSWIEEQKYRDGIFIDVGANIGNHTIFFSKILNRETWSFEPYGVAHRALERNVEVNRLNNVKLFEIGLSDSESFGEMFVQNDGNIGTAAIVNSSKSNDSVELKVGDSVLREANSISLIKIDVEGFELNVLRGIRNTIDKHSPTLLVECMSSVEFENTINYLSPLGYTPRAVFGATPMIVFERNIFPISKESDFSIHNLTRYLELSDAYNRTRASAQNLNSKVDNLSELLSESRQKAFSHYKKSEYYRRSHLESKRALEDVQRSMAFKLGKLIVFPAKFVKHFLKFQK